MNTLLDKAMILQVFRSEELNRQRNNNPTKSLNKVQVFRKGMNLAEIVCFFCKLKGHTKRDCRKFKAWLENQSRGASGPSEGAKKAEGETASVITEFAGKPSSVDFAYATSSNIFHWNTDTGRIKVGFEIILNIELLFSWQTIVLFNLKALVVFCLDL